MYWKFGFATQQTKVTCILFCLEMLLCIAAHCVACGSQMSDGHSIKVIIESSCEFHNIQQLLLSNKCNTEQAELSLVWELYMFILHLYKPTYV
jgi:hypothetical protein